MCHLYIPYSSLILWHGWDKKNPFTIPLQVTIVAIVVMTFLEPLAKAYFEWNEELGT